MEKTSLLVPPVVLPQIVRQRPLFFGSLSFFIVALLLLLTTFDTSPFIACTGDGTWCRDTILQTTQAKSHSQTQMGNKNSANVQVGIASQNGDVKQTGNGPLAIIPGTNTINAPNSDLEGLDLRVMQIGDSITVGHGTPGYRVPLAPLLLSSSARSVDYVGSVTWGTGLPANMSNALVALIGAGVDSVAVAAIAAFPVYRPNVILIHLGTNDVVSQTNVSTLAARLFSLVEEAQRACPIAVVLLARLLPASFREAEVESVNRALDDGVEAQKGKLVLVDMFTGFGDADMVDLIHLSEAGYVKMAERWTEGIRRAARLRWVEQPVEIPEAGSRRKMGRR